MMYRQISVNKSQQNLQRILWKWGKDEPVKIYNLTTVTYGTACAPYLATRSLKQLSEDEKETFPEAASVLASDTYMDDILTGESSLDRAKLLQTQLVNLLAKGQFELHKWSSNAPELLDNIPEQQREYSFNEPSDARVIKTLGLLWNPKFDFFSYKVSVSRETLYTKRDVLSQIARIFDPLGLIGPVIAKMKILLQRLWLKKLSWTDHIGEPEATEWHLIITSLQAVQELKIPRFVFQDNVIAVFLEGFADASTVGFGACVYLKTISQQGKITISLMCSRSRVAPMKPLTVPRLELSACLLLSKLVTKTSSAIKIDLDGINLYTDSTIALAWIQTPPHKLKTYVSHRVNEIQLLTDKFTWSHVPSTSNPADILSRGATPEELISNELWFKGPSFLYSYLSQPDYWERPDETVKDYISEIKDKQLDSSTCLLLPKTNGPTFLHKEAEIDFVNHFCNLSNNYFKLIRILSFIYRFIHNCKSEEKFVGPISKGEFDHAKTRLIKLVQVMYFSREIKALKKGEPLKDSRVSNLNPFLDKDEVIRVGGRLDQSNLSYDKKHPILLPKDHKLTLLIFQYFHLKNLHVGAQTLLHFVRQEFWPLNGRNIARKIVHNCIVCFKNKPKILEQIMASLPKERVTINPPFTNSGIDLCGPFLIKYKHQRKGVFNKIYVAIFVCFATRATHLEIITDLSSEALIATLKRFVARRGICATIFSDNASNFVGANSELKKLHKLVKIQSDDLSSYLLANSISWRFLPPRSPNFGGLWEAGVKSFKHHLKRTVGNSKLTFEEFLTVINQIEGILNSRPLIPLSSDPSDYEALSPGHFLIGRPINSISEPSLTDLADNKLSHWQRVTKINQLIWKKWSRDYLNNLHQRSKWQFEKENVKMGTMVLLRDGNLPMCTWSIGRVQEVIFGKDGKVRVVMIKTPCGVFKRGISNICILPINNPLF